MTGGPAPGGSDPIRVLLVDDQQIIRVGVARILSPADGFEVVGECADGGAVTDAVRRLTPDLVVMDVRMPVLDGVEATRQLTGEPDHPPVLALTTFGEDDVLWSMLEAGASGFILKSAGADDLIAAARAVARGGAWFDPEVTGRVLTAYRQSVAPARRTAQRLDTLTDRERDVLRSMARGANNREIAEGLFVSEGTVKSHVGAIFTKLGVRDRAAAIVYAYDHDVVRPRER